MDSRSASPPPPLKDAEVNPSVTSESGTDNTADTQSKLSAAGISTWAKSLKIPQPFSATQDDSSTGNNGKSPFARFTSGLGLRTSPKSPQTDDSSEGISTTAQPGFIGTFTKGLVDSSKNAVKAVQVKARHVVSQNKRRYQEGGFDLDMTYITENIIAMGFPAGDMSSGFFGYVEGFYRNHMEEVIKFFETHHKDKYKVYNLCSERLYDASLFEGKVASFPFDDHNCPPIQLIISFCQSAYSWLKQDIENVVVVHCKAGMARTGLMISSLLLYLKFFPTAEESMDYYNQKRCVDGKGLVLPSQIRYVKYFERILTYFNGENQPGRRCMLRGFRLHRCPYWIRPHITVSDHNGVLFSSKKHPRTKDLTPEDFWFSAPKKGVMVFALPGEPGLAELTGDFKIHFHDRQGDFYCWLNTTMMENRKVLITNDLDGFDKRKLPSPGFQVEVVLVDYTGPVPASPGSETGTETVAKESSESSGSAPAPVNQGTTAPKENKNSGNQDDVFSDSEAEEGGSVKSRQGEAVSADGGAVSTTSSNSETNPKSDQVANLTRATEQVSLGNVGSQQTNAATEPKKDAISGLGAANTESEFKAMAADASVFSFGDEEDYESE
ncbi:hypothetical protein LWI29_010999 [Acer saccharum]|uniref:Phosphatidylinositol 3,4,5-trisphosphate 3-phosphatase and protein-tyrosine-phosphatase PTEN2A-like n=1 Tax=Acer saccharum TaxID=4024 RepID=A0AA39S338_ACESA|nr:hypothetical protein LWI29_010999 [Acer saccharum]KAK1560664.1 hypothetical protein Q3G72_029435 [Acer saccharum]